MTTTLRDQGRGGGPLWPAGDPLGLGPPAPGAEPAAVEPAAAREPASEQWSRPPSEPPTAPATEPPLEPPDEPPTGPRTESPTEPLAASPLEPPAEPDPQSAAEPTPAVAEPTPAAAELIPAAAEPIPTAAAEPGEPASRRGIRLRRLPGWWRGVAAVLAVVLFAALAAGAVLQGLRVRRLDAASSSRQAALAAARVEAVNLTTIGYRAAGGDVTRIIDGATGSLRAQFTAERAQFPSVLTKQKANSVGVVLSAGVVTATSRSAEVLLAVDATISNSATASAHTSSVVKHYRIVMSLSRVHGQWLASSVAFAGVPQ